MNHSEVLFVRGLHKVCMAPVGVHYNTQGVLLIRSSQHNAQFANQPDSESQLFFFHYWPCMHFDIDDTHYLAHVLYMGHHQLHMVICAACSMLLLKCSTLASLLIGGAHRPQVAMPKRGGKKSAQQAEDNSWVEETKKRLDDVAWWSKTWIQKAARLAPPSHAAEVQGLH